MSFKSLTKSSTVNQKYLNKLDKSKNTRIKLLHVWVGPYLLKKLLFLKIITFFAVERKLNYDLFKPKSVIVDHKNDKPGMYRYYIHF